MIIPPKYCLPRRLASTSSLVSAQSTPAVEAFILPVLTHPFFEMLALILSGPGWRMTGSISHMTFHTYGHALPSWGARTSLNPKAWHLSHTPYSTFLRDFRNSLRVNWILDLPEPFPHFHQKLLQYFKENLTWNASFSATTDSTGWISPKQPITVATFSVTTLPINSASHPHKLVTCHLQQNCILLNPLYSTGLHC